MGFCLFIGARRHNSGRVSAPHGADVGRRVAAATWEENNVHCSNQFIWQSFLNVNKQNKDYESKNSYWNLTNYMHH